MMFIFALCGQHNLILTSCRTMQFMGMLYVVPLVSVMSFLLEFCLSSCAFQPSHLIIYLSSFLNTKYTVYACLMDILSNCFVSLSQMGYLFFYNCFMYFKIKGYSFHSTFSILKLRTASITVPQPQDNVHADIYYQQTGRVTLTITII